MDTEVIKPDTFNGSVPLEIKQKLYTLAKEIYDTDFGDVVTGWKQTGRYGAPNMDGIYGYHVSGFIPFQWGGYEVSEFFRCDQDSSYHFNQKQTDYVTEQASQAWLTWCRELGVDTNAGWDDLSDAEQESFCRYEDEWLQPALLRFQGWVNKGGGEVTLGLYLNYRDQPYYREKHDEILKCKTYGMEEFMAMPIEEIIKSLGV